MDEEGFSWIAEGRTGFSLSVFELNKRKSDRLKPILLKARTLQEK
jgi:hypothetical protein